MIKTKVTNDRRRKSGERISTTLVRQPQHMHIMVYIYIYINIYKHVVRKSNSHHHQRHHVMVVVVVKVGIC